MKKIHTLTEINDLVADMSYNNIRIFKAKLSDSVVQLDISSNGLRLFKSILPPKLTILNLSWNNLISFNISFRKRESEKNKHPFDKLFGKSSFDMSLPQQLYELNLYCNNLRSFNTLIPKSLKILLINDNFIKKLKLNRVPLYYFRHDVIKNKKMFDKKCFYNF
jgi:hypothetical protein